FEGRARCRGTVRWQRYGWHALVPRSRRMIQFKRYALALAVHEASSRQKAFLFGRDGFVFAFQSSMEGVPGERCAFDPHRELADAGKDGQLTEICLRRRPGSFAGKESVE